MDKGLADRIRECLKKSGFKQGDAAYAAELSPAQMSKSLTGERRFTTGDVAKLADFFGVSMYWLVTGEYGEYEPKIAARHTFNDATKKHSADNLEQDRQLLSDVALLYRQAYGR